MNVISLLIIVGIYCLIDLVLSTLISLFLGDWEGQVFSILFYLIGLFILAIYLFSQTF